MASLGLNSGYHSGKKKHGSVFTPASAAGLGAVEQQDVLVATKDRATRPGIRDSGEGIPKCREKCRSEKPGVGNLGALELGLLLPR